MPCMLCHASSGGLTISSLQRSCRSSCDRAGSTADLWHTGYRLNEDMRPTFITRQLACTILRAGKSINFLRPVYALLMT